MGATTVQRRKRRSWLSLLLVAVAAFLSVAAAQAGSSKKAADSPEVAKATRLSAPYLKAPTSVGTTVALSKKPPAGQTVIALSCTLSVCAAWRDQVIFAAKQLNWKASGAGFDGTPEDTLKKVQDAIAKKQAAIIINGMPRGVFEAVLQDAIDNNVAIVTQMGELTGKATPPFIAVQYQAKEFDVMSKATGNWVISHSKGKASALLVGYANFPLSIRIRDVMTDTIKNGCSSCSTTKLTVQAADTGTKLPSAVVSAIQRNPKINYVVLQDAAMAAGLDAALREAGLEGKVNVLGNNVTPEVAQSTVDGTELGWMAFSLRAAAFQGVDAVARHLVGDKQVNVPLMNQILTKATFGKKPTSDTWNNIPPDLVQKYKKLWRVR